MDWYKTSVPDEELQHHGILGQKWGVRRFQNADGTWTEAGKERYGSQESSSKAYSDKEKKSNAKSYNKYRSNGKIDPVLYDNFTNNNKQLIDEWVGLEKKRLEMLRDKGPEAVAKRATEKYMEEKSKPKDPFDEMEMIGEDIYSHDQWDMDDAEYLLGKSDKEFNSIASKGVAKNRELYDAWMNEVHNYAGDSAKDSFAMRYNAEKKAFKDATGRDDISYYKEFYDRMNAALDAERNKIQHFDDNLWYAYK